ncbi:NAD(P)/FAD-dependent oxidoreductase [Amphritea balenae]|uniref:FAD-binding oxidoreductase n=1 Tax=Amphritea balenae TaxID=452629 RepID=A0A3P1SP27_9GAMM|nr:FAD-binding oxidoreductase [Amphritea balenae]RRC98887.1 FAD-binding oxidoreductase [Amphritea balenae]GGK62555.1 amino acid dehydrogenase [Amphritea balenae]
MSQQNSPDAAPAVSSAADVTVVGAGIIGISCALALQKKGLSVRVVDKLGPGEGTSFGNAGVIAECGCVPVNLPGFAWKVPGLMLDSHGPLSIPMSYMHKAAPWGLSFIWNSRTRHFNRVADALDSILRDATQKHLQQARENNAEDWVKASPYYYLYRDEDNFKADSVAWNARESRGISYDVVQGSALHQQEPGVSDQFNYALSLHNHGFVRSPEKLVKTLADSFVAKGGQIQLADIRDIQITDGQPSALITHKETLPVKQLVIAAGVWSRKLAAKLDRDIPLQSERGYHIEVRNPGITLHSPIMFADGKLVATPMENGIRFAGLVEFGDLEAEPNEEFCHRLFYHAKRLFPQINTEDYTEWMGHRPSLPDSLPVIGCSQNYGNVFYAFGHQHMGLTLGPHTGELIAQLVTGEQPDIDLTPFSISRF